MIGNHQNGSVQLKVCDARTRIYNQRGRAIVKVEMCSHSRSHLLDCTVGVEPEFVTLLVFINVNSAGSF
jgi:hypothetical protein